MLNLNLGKLLSEDGSTSAMRVAVLGCLLLFFPAFTAIWLKVSWATSAMAPIPDSVTWLVGTLLGAKIGQKLLEVGGRVLGDGKP